MSIEPRTGKSAKPAIRRAVEKLEKFHQSIVHLGYHSDHPRYMHIKELDTIIATSAVDLPSRGVSRIVWDAGQENPILDAVQETVGLLEEDLQEIIRQIVKVGNPSPNNHRNGLA